MFVYTLLMFVSVFNYFQLSNFFIRGDDEKQKTMMAMVNYL